MQTYSRRPIDATKILSRQELAAVLADLKRKAPRSRSTRLNLAIFRLACCCGLRASEIAKVRVADVVVETRRPHIRIRRGAAKGGRSRIVPLWWDAGTLADLAAWKAERVAQGTGGEDYYIGANGARWGPWVRRRPGCGRAQSLRRSSVIRSAAGSAPPVRCWGLNGSARSPSTTAATRLSATPWLEAEHWPRSAMQRDTPTSVLPVPTCTWR